MNRAERRLGKKGLAAPHTIARLSTLLAPAIALQKEGRLPAAVAAYREALRVEPANPAAWCAVSYMLVQLQSYEEALEAARTAATYNPKLPEAHHNLGVAYMNLGAFPQAMRSYAEAARLSPNNWRHAQNLLLASLYRSDMTVEQTNDLHKTTMARFNVPQRGPVARPDAHERIRVGYLSSDLYQHPVTDILLPVVKRLDPARFEIFFYSHDSFPDHVTESLRRIATKFRSIDNLSDADAAALIRRDNIDVLVSLSGHFNDNRPLVCAHRAAPVQISMHNVVTSGLREMDYFVADRWTLPASARDWFSEEIVCIEPIYMVDGAPELPPIRERVGDGPVFGSFNNPLKISDACLTLWGRILARLPAARLALRYRDAYANQSLRRRILTGVCAAGANPSQVVFYRGTKVSMLEHLDQYNAIDVALDTFPFSGSTTTFQTLVMGVPLVALAGDRMAGRWSESILRTVGRQDYIAATPEEYVELACATTALPLEARAAQRALVVRSSLCDADSYARQVQDMFIELVQRRARAPA
ncbi:MAG TPA: tetratricopeptide repeat protein [Stellaceae bacterium]|nr:tetratricopeptide repeat protein [Stellaceae bacterium]